MTLYREFLKELEDLQDLKYREFHLKLLKNNNLNVIGVKIPYLKKLAVKYSGETDNLLTFPDEYYEVTFVKLSVVALLDYDNFVSYVENCVKLIDNWATCDSFAPKCIEAHKDEFLPYIRKFSSSDMPYTRRFALTALIHFYVEEKYLETIFSIVERCDNSDYYVHMASAWLISETLVKYYDRAVGFLSDNTLDKKTHNKAIQKACESFRLSNDRKNFLKGMKR